MLLPGETARKLIEQQILDLHAIYMKQIDTHLIKKLRNKASAPALTLARSWLHQYNHSSMR